MICPKCKKQISEKTLKCSHCGSKIASFCKNCNAYNLISNINCEKCNAQLLKICPSCKSVNLPNSTTCRKCGCDFLQVSASKKPMQKDFLEQEIIEDEPIVENFKDLSEVLQEQTLTEAKNTPIEESKQKPSETINLNYDAELFSQQKAKELLIKGILSENKRVISLSGQKGVGKTIVLKSAINELQDNDIIWLLGECSPITQISPCGLIQNFLLTFFNVSNYCSDSLKLKKDSQKFFQSEFPTLTNEEIFNLLNLIYPTNSDYFENILINKDKTFTFLNKVFKTIIENNKTVFIVENFDYIDGFSYEFLHNLINTEFTNSPAFLITYEEIRPGRGYLYNDKLNNDAYLDLSLNNFDKNQMNIFIDQYFKDEKCPDRLKEKLFKVSGGNPAILEQLVSLTLESKSKNGVFDIAVPPTFDGIVYKRLELLKESPVAYKVLSLAAIQGIKFHSSIINEILRIEESQLSEILNSLQRLNFIVPVSEFSYAFKNSLLWESLLECIRQDEMFAVLNENIYEVYSNYVLSSNAIMAVIAQNLNQDLSAFRVWTDNIKLASYIGDTNLYAISQKQCLILIEKLEDLNNSMIKNNIYERLGKLLSKSNPKEAIEYLPNAISNAKKLNNPLKEIELTGYMASCCISLGDYYGTIECIDSTIEKIDSNFDLEIAMLKSRKLNALLNIGNSGEIINLVDAEIMPVFEKYINAKPHPNVSIKTLYKAWLQSYLDLANALIFQGNSRAFDVITTLFELFEKNKFDNNLFICKTKLALAFANTVKGDVEASEEILSEVIKVYRTDIMDNQAISRWNLINILNNFIHKKYNGLKEELFQVVTYANNINDNFTKNILKTLLGKLFKDEENAKRALDIYSEQITYFAKEKNAIGALLTWYLIAEATLIVEGPEKSLEVSQKALEVSQSPKINSYLFIILYNKVIAEAFMAQADYESAKIHLEKAIVIAKKFELLNLLADLYLLYGKYLQDIALIKSEAQYEYVSGSYKMYKKAYLIAQGLKNHYIANQVEKAKTVLNSFCQLNGIIIKDA